MGYQSSLFIQLIGIIKENVVFILMHTLMYYEVVDFKLTQYMHKLSKGELILGNK